MSHVIGKVYDLTQENFQKVIAELEALQAQYKYMEDKYVRAAITIVEQEMKIKELEHYQRIKDLS